MICGNCAQGGDHYRKFGNKMVAKEFHDKCLSPKHCDCQHRIADRDKVIQPSKDPSA